MNSRLEALRAIVGATKETDHIGRPWRKKWAGRNYSALRPRGNVHNDAAPRPAYIFTFSLAAPFIAVVESCFDYSTYVCICQDVVILFLFAPRVMMASLAEVVLFYPLLPDIFMRLRSRLPPAGFLWKVAGQLSSFARPLLSF